MQWPCLLFDGTQWKDNNKNKGTTALHQVQSNHSVPFNESFEFIRTLNVTQSTNMVESCIVRFSIRQVNGLTEMIRRILCFLTHNLGVWRS